MFITILRGALLSFIALCFAYNYYNFFLSFILFVRDFFSDPRFLNLMENERMSAHFKFLFLSGESYFHLKRRKWPTRWMDRWKGQFWLLTPLKIKAPLLDCTKISNPTSFYFFYRSKIQFWLFCVFRLFLLWCLNNTVARYIQIYTYFSNWLFSMYQNIFCFEFNAL